MGTTGVGHAVHHDIAAGFGNRHNKHVRPHKTTPFSEAGCNHKQSVGSSHVRETADTVNTSAPQLISSAAEEWDSCNECQ